MRWSTKYHCLLCEWERNLMMMWERFPTWVPSHMANSHPTQQQQRGKREKDHSKPIFTYYNSKGICTLKKKSTCLLCGDGAHLGVLSVAKHSGTNCKVPWQLRLQSWKQLAKAKYCKNKWLSLPHVSMLYSVISYPLYEIPRLWMLGSASSLLPKQFFNPGEKKEKKIYLYIYIYILTR